MVRSLRQVRSNRRASFKRLFKLERRVSKLRWKDNKPRQNRLGNDF